MSKILHIIRNEHDTKALEYAQLHSLTEDTAIISFQSESLEAVPEPRKTCIVEGTSKLNNGHTIGYDELVHMIFEHDSIVVW